MNQTAAPTNLQSSSALMASRRFDNDPRFVLKNLVSKDFKVRYRNMSLGIFWSLVNRLIMMGVLTFIFTVVFTRGIPNYPLFLLCGLLPYNFFTMAWATGTMSVVTNASLVKQVRFQRELVPVSVVLGNALHYALQLALLLIAVGIVVGVNVQWMWLPVVLSLQVIFVCGLSLLTSALDVYYRDVRYVVESVNRVLFWLVPIFYGFGDVRPDLVWLYEINPVAAVVLVMRRILLYAEPPGATLLKLAVAAIIAVWVGYTVFARVEDEFSDYLEGNG